MSTLRKVLHWFICRMPGYDHAVYFSHQQTHCKKCGRKLWP